MPTKQLHSERPKMAYSCYHTRNREGEQFVPEHIFGYQISGSMMMSDGQKEIVFNPDDFRFIRRNNLVKFLKIPAPNGDFKSVSVYLDQQTLRNFSMEYGFKATGHYAGGDAAIKLPPQPLYKSFMESIIPYQSADITIDDKLQDLKLREAILILLQSKPEIKDILFDFNEPGKIDLEGFMEKNFHFNVQLKRFAYLTGRSLATFKRDFEKIYHITPSRWLQQRRLQEAYYLIKEKGKSASDIYIDLGFEDLSHFSYAFKNKYGVAPSRL
ncbi:helix-turn-helix domain-containing protein [Mucilaginibacter lutimaris]|uniref:Helix-turn-helix domain-containing protein n=1 Tax=Mucilaginibacter lutimaris TaxID=931629 RepID=A0ABW2ZF36_9SPHI